MSKLKPCPWCGSPASYQNKGAQHWIECSKVCSITTLNFNEQEKAAEWWNRRSNAEAIAALEKIKDKLFNHQRDALKEDGPIIMGRRYWLDRVEQDIVDEISRLREGKE